MELGTPIRILGTTKMDYASFAIQPVREYVTWEIYGIPFTNSPMYRIRETLKDASWEHYIN